MGKFKAPARDIAVWQVWISSGGGNLHLLKEPSGVFDR